MKWLIEAGTKIEESFEEYRYRKYGFTFTQKQDRQAFHEWLRFYKIIKMTSK